MASRAVGLRVKPIRMNLPDGSTFYCSCGSSEFRTAGEGISLHLFCRCGLIYTQKDLSPPEES